MVARVRASFLGCCIGAIAEIAPMGCFAWAASTSAAQREAGYRVQLGLVDNTQMRSMALRESGGMQAEGDEPPAEPISTSVEYALSLASMPLMGSAGRRVRR